MLHYLAKFQGLVLNHWNVPALGNYKGKMYTYGQVATAIEKIHIIFSEAGIRKGDKIALCAKNSAEWAMAFLASNIYESVTVPILADFHPENVNSLVDHSESLILFTDKDIWAKLDIEKMPKVRAVFACEGFELIWTNDEKLKAANENVEKLFAEKFPHGFSGADINYPTDNLDNLALINYTSGTTSAPKGVMITYRALVLNVDFFHRYFVSEIGETIVSMLPMAHMYGLLFELLSPVSSGMTVTYLGKTPTASVLLKALGEVKPAVLISVPLVLEKVFKSAVAPKISTPAMKFLLKVPGINKVILNTIKGKLMAAFGGNIRQIVLGGAALNPEVEYWFQRIGIPFTVGYGMTEGAPLFAYEFPWKFVRKSCGRAVNYVDVRIVSPDPEHVEGEIQFKGGNVMLGYYKNPEATAEAFTEDGWLRTGDLGVMRPDRTLFIRGRKKNMILSANGQNIYPEEIEAVINNEPNVVETVVVDRGGRLVALVYFDPAFTKTTPVNSEEFSEMLERMRVEVNKSMPAYSKLAKFEAVEQPFEKTPKMSIKRFLYS